MKYFYIALEFLLSFFLSASVSYKNALQKGKKVSKDYYRIIEAILYDG